LRANNKKKDGANKYLKYRYPEMEKVVRGRLLLPTRRGLFQGKISLDSRTIQPGDMFIPLKGTRFDGHQFLGEAFDRGARLALCEYQFEGRLKRKYGDIIFVENTLQAMGRLAAYHRRKFKIPVVAITGSCGKTTTKDILAHVLESKYCVLKSRGSENNFVGVPKTLLSLNDDHQIAVIEVGSNRIGEIRHLSRLVNPTHAVLTLIGNAHLTGFRSVEGVRTEKISMVDALENDSVLIYNAEDKNIRHRRFKKLRTVRVGFKKTMDVYADKIDLLSSGSTFLLNRKIELKSPLLGHHNILNVLLALAAAEKLGINRKFFAERIASFQPTRGRVRYQEVQGIHWIDDSYNSNPTSLRAAIELFKDYPPRGRKILVLGDMLELGPRASLFHREAGQTVASHPFDLVITVGEFSKDMVEGAVNKGFVKKKLKSFRTSEEAGDFLKGQLKSEDTVLLKGSRALRMEKVIECCTNSSTP
jgi:UDP-N-acetylmuramoyl-tripeptide--D-alanyl-D-alanine ligase